MWVAYGVKEGSNATLYLGTTSTPEAAAKLYDDWAIKHYGSEFARLNFP